MDIKRLYNKCYFPYTQWKLPEDYFLKLPDHYSFDLIELKKFIEASVQQVGLQNLRMDDKETIFNIGYKGMGFTHRKVAPDPHHDAFRLFNEQGQYDTSASSKQTMKALLSASPIHRFEKNFTERSELIHGPLEKVLNQFKSLITKVRVVELGAGQELHEHFDFPYYENVRVHAAIETNDQVEWWVEDKKFQMPSDGNFYWFDTGRAHKVINKGATIRRILSVHLSVYKDKDDKLLYGPETSLPDLISKSLI